MASSIQDPKLQKEVVLLNPNKKNDNVKWNELTPNSLLRLNQEGDVSLTEQQIRLLEEWVKTKISIGEPQPKNLEDMTVYELPKWVFDWIPEVNSVQLNNKLNEFKILDNIPPKKILEMENENKVDLPHLMNKDLNKIMKVIEAAKNPSFNINDFKISDRVLPKIGNFRYFN